MKTTLLIFSQLILLTNANAQQNYDVSIISKDLLPYASAVIRNEQVTVEVKDLDNVTYRVKKAITVLNKNGDDIAHMSIFYNKNTIVKYIRGIALNEFGKQIAKFNAGDFADQSAVSTSSLFDDERIKQYIPAITSYPYTIEYEYELRYKQTLLFNDWEPIPETNLSVEKSTYTFICKPDFNIRYKVFDVPDQVIIGTDQKGVKTYVWSIKNLKAIKYEPYAPLYNSNFICVKIAPEKFNGFGIDGSFTNWKELGSWQYHKLNANRQDLPVETIDHIRAITKDIADPKFKAKKVYEYMQSKTHYISIQVGIGGYQPFLASDVDKQNYGDCKALVNYTQALLKAVDIESYYCVVKSGEKYKVDFLNDFASMEQGDHIILCIPFKKDTTWADCTSQTIPFGYLGAFTDDRVVLACTPEGGKLMHTPKYLAKDNLESRKADFIINEAGELTGIMSTVFKGTDYEDRDELFNEPVKEQYKTLQKIYPINNLSILTLDIKQDKSFTPFTAENIKLEARDYASLDDGKYYFMVNPANRRTTVPKQVINRLNEVYINRGYTEEDDIHFTVPANYHLDKKPLDDKIDKPFAKFTVTMEQKGNQLTYRRKFQLIEGTYGKDTYQELVDFYQNVVDADSYTVSLVKN